MLKKIKGLGQMMYLDVILRTSGSAFALGIMAAILVNGVTFNWVGALLGFIIILLMQSFAQHSLDTIMDESPPEDSAFRGKVLRTFSKTELRKIFIFASILTFLTGGLTVFFVRHWLLIPVILLGYYFVVQYAKTNIESYPGFAFAGCALGGWLTQTDMIYTSGKAFIQHDMVILSLCIALTGLYLIGQKLYRIDDYDREMTSKQKKFYFRWSLRFIHHPTQWAWLGFMMIACGNYRMQIAGTVIAWIPFILWFITRHRTCNNLNCINSRVRRLECLYPNCNRKCTTCKYGGKHLFRGKI